MARDPRIRPHLLGLLAESGERSLGSGTIFGERARVAIGPEDSMSRLVSPAESGERSLGSGNYFGVRPRVAIGPEDLMTRLRAPSRSRPTNFQVDPNLWAAAHSDGNPQKPKNRHPSTGIRSRLRNLAENVHEKTEKKAF